MSSTSNNYNAENHLSVGSQTTEDKQSDNKNPQCTYWVRHDGREFLTDPNGEIVSLARLTAYAEHGEAIHEAQAHHELPQLKIDAPRFLRPLAQEDHGQYHLRDPDPVDIGGFPLFRPGP